MAAMMSPIYDVNRGRQGCVERDIELFRRILESLARQSVEVNLEQNHLSGGLGGRMARVYFREWGVYSMVDVHQFQYGHGEAGIEQVAKATYKMAAQHMDKYMNGRMRDAYQSMATFEPDWKKQGGASPPPQKMQEPLKGSFENPLRVEFQKKVDAWLK